jgi:hypothetical protein
MNTLSRNKLIDAVGLSTAIAGALALAAIVVPADPLGRSIGALLGASLLLGAAGAFVRESLVRRMASRRAAQHGLRVAAVPTVAPLPRPSDGTASEFDDQALPAFAPVVSLTEAQVERQRAARRLRERRSALTQA